MGTRKELPGGLLIPERCTFAALAANDGSATGSDYSEANPRPGLPIVASASSELRLELSGEQGVDVDVRCQKSGQPALDGLQLAIRDAAKTAYLTSESYSNCTGMIPGNWGTDDSRRQTVATIPSSQTVIYSRYQFSSTAARLATIDISQTQTEHTAQAPGGSTWNYPCVVVLPGRTERVVLIHGGASYYSDDQGATLNTLSDAVTDEATLTYGYTAGCVFRGDIVLFVEDTTTTDRIHHLVSTDGGSTFNLVQTTDQLGQRVQCVANDDGIHLVWVNQGPGASPSTVEYRRLGSAFEPLDAVASTILTTGPEWDEACIWADYAGALQVLYTGAGANEAYIVASLDAGNTWSTSYRARSWNPGDPNDYHEYLRATYAMGQAFVLMSTNNGSGGIAQRPMAVVLGGWSDTQFTAAAGSMRTLLPQERWGFGPHDLSASEVGQTYFPIYLPQNSGWTVTGPGNLAISDANRSLNINTSAAKGHSTQDIGSTPTDLVARARVKVASGGTTTLPDIGIALRLADASTYEYEAHINLSLSGTTLTITVNDVNSAASTSAAFEHTAYVDIYAQIDTNNEAISVFYRYPGVYEWTQVGGGAVALTDAGATANNGRIEWGHIDTGTAESDWREFHYAAASGTAVPELVRAIATRGSRAFNSRPEPVPDVGTSNGVAFLAAVSGPALIGELASIPLHHDYPIEHAHAELFPGRDTKWRSTDTTEQIIAYDLGADAWVGHSIALYIRDANFQTAYLESYDAGGATWDLECTLDLSEGLGGGASPLEYTLAGEMVYPDTATTSPADRWLWEQELRGGVAIFAASVGPVKSATRILAQSSGGWTQSTTAIPMLQLEDVSVISTHTGTKNVRFCAPAGLVVKHLTAVKARRRWRVRIPAGVAGDDTPEGENYYEASLIAVCRVQPFGAGVGWGDSDEAQPNKRTHEDERGTIRSREMGVERRTWVLGGWAQSPANHGQNVRLGPGADYVGSSEAGALALGGYEDIYHHLRGLYRVLKSGAVPCVAVKEIPNTSDQTLNDPSRFIFGELTSSISARRQTGHYDDTQGQGEVLRVEDITVREVV